MDLERWVFSLRSHSLTTAKVYSNALDRFCEFASITPREVVEDVERTERALVEFVKRHPASSARAVYYAVRSWLRFNGVEMKLKLRFDVESRVAREEAVPKPEDVKKLIDYAPLKTKVVIALMAYAGVRPEVIGNHDGSNGLRVEDLPELSLYPDPKFLVTPARVVVRPSLSKARHQYFTFLNDRACEVVERYLKKRGNVEPAEPLVEGKNGEFLKTGSISTAVRRVIRLCGFEFRPYALRHFFDTYMLMAEGARIIPRDYRVFWMGHRGDIEAVYTTNKNKLPPELVEDMRSKYERASELLLQERGREREEAEPTQKVVSCEEVDGYLERGWVYVTTLPNGKVIVKRP
ncbi:tyrosine-type recombinase/integrase [Archaeoglobus neptunius]|uniref:tyrosine-type recombinase/integrase n=1 Tax=Archaeoglobus neptunius TaxID=2798580 RepID=UPI001926E4EE|nr:site-specific integrase [Archaeoglobus neptunius]